MFGAPAGKRKEREFPFDKFDDFLYLIGIQDKRFPNIGIPAPSGIKNFPCLFQIIKVLFYAFICVSNIFFIQVPFQLFNAEISFTPGIIFNIVFEGIDFNKFLP